MSTLFSFIFLVFFSKIQNKKAVLNLCFFAFPQKLFLMITSLLFFVNNFLLKS